MIGNLLTDALGRRKDNFDWRSAQPCLDLDAVETVCVIHHNKKAGDAVLISLLVDALAQTRPGLKVYVACSSSFVGYWSAHPDVAEAIAYDGGRDRPIVARVAHAVRVARSWRGRFDVAVSFQPFARPEHFALLRCLRPCVLIGFNKDPYRLFDYSLEEHRHGVDLAPVATRARSVMRTFGIDVDVARLRPHVPFGPSDEALARDALAGPTALGPRLLVNAYGAAPSKRLSPATVRWIVDEARRHGHAGPVYVSAPPDAVDEYAASLKGESGCGVKVLGPLGGLSALCALVAAVDVVVSPDTAVGHIAAAFHKPQVCLFARQGSVPETWRPLNDRCWALTPRSGDGVDAVDKAELSGALALALSACGAADQGAAGRRSPGPVSCDPLATGREVAVPGTDGASPRLGVLWTRRLGRADPGA